MDTSTKPHLQPVDELLEAAIDLEDPSILLTQATDYLSLVISKSAAVRDMGQTLWLEECRWVLFAPGYIGVYPVAAVAVSCLEDGYWTAKDAAAGKLLRWPSERAYFIRFISGEEYALFDACLHLMKLNTFLEHAVPYFSVAPGFHLAPPGKLVAPRDYASVGKSRIPPGSLLEVPVEFRLS